MLLSGRRRSPARPASPIRPSQPQSKPRSSVLTADLFMSPVVFCAALGSADVSPIVPTTTAIGKIRRVFMCFSCFELGYLLPTQGIASAGPGFTRPSPFYTLPVMHEPDGRDKSHSLRRPGGYSAHSYRWYRDCSPAREGGRHRAEMAIRTDVGPALVLAQVARRWEFPGIDAHIRFKDRVRC